MGKYIIFKNNKGVNLLVPHPDFDIDSVARKDVPNGVPYGIIDSSELPSGIEYMDAWDVVIDTPDGYGIGQEAWFLEQAAKESGNG